MNQQQTNGGQEVSMDREKWRYMWERLHPAVDSIKAKKEEDTGVYAHNWTTRGSGARHSHAIKKLFRK